MTTIERMKYIMNLDWFEIRDDEDVIKQLIYDILTDDIGVCKWKYDADGFWNTECNIVFFKGYTDPKRNNYFYCPGCGKKIEVVK
jgi:hypothetical protein